MRTNCSRKLKDSLFELAPNSGGWKERLKSLADSPVTVTIMENTRIKRDDEWL